MGFHRGRPDPARHPARWPAGRPLRPTEAIGRQARAADARARQPPLPARLPGHRRRGAGAPARAVRGRPGAAGRRPLVCAGRSHRGAGGRRLRARDPPRAGAKPAGGVPLDPGAPSPAVRRSLARFARRHGADRRGQSQYCGADARLALLDLFRARLSLAHARRAAGGRRRPGGARRRGLDQDARRPAPRAHAAAPPRQLLRRPVGAARRTQHLASPAWSRPRASARSRSPTRSVRAWWKRRR